jgi:hypothetical protein
VRRRWRLTQPPYNIFGNPQRDECFAGAASHERGSAIVVAQCGQNMVEGFGLMRERRLWFPFDFPAFKPRANCCEVRRFEFIKIVASDRIERGALLHQTGEAVAVRDEHALVNAIREADECG